MALTEESYDKLSYTSKTCYIIKTWANVKTYDEFLEKSIEFIKGNIFATPTHMNPLHFDSKLLIDDLIALHEKRLITFSGQGMIDTDKIKQKCYLSFICEKNDKTKALLDDIMVHPDLTWKIRFDTDDVKRNYTEKYHYVSKRTVKINGTPVLLDGYCLSSMKAPIFKGWVKLDDLNDDDYYRVDVAFKSWTQTGLEYILLKLCDKHGI